MPETTLVLEVSRYDLSRPNIQPLTPSESIDRFVQEREVDMFVVSDEKLAAQRAIKKSPAQEGRLGHFEDVLYSRNGEIYSVNVWTTKDHIFDQIV